MTLESLHRKSGIPTPGITSGCQEFLAWLSRWGAVAPSLANLLIAGRTDTKSTCDDIAWQKRRDFGQARSKDVPQSRHRVADDYNRQPLRLGCGLDKLHKLFRHDVWRRWHDFGLTIVLRLVARIFEFSVVEVSELGHDSIDARCREIDHASPGLCHVRPFFSHAPHAGSQGARLERVAQ